MRQGQGSADGAPAEVLSAPPKMQAVGSQCSVVGAWLAVVEDLGNDSGMTILCFFLLI
jgi:hypothetical protein